MKIQRIQILASFKVRGVRIIEKVVLFTLVGLLSPHNYMQKLALIFLLVLGCSLLKSQVPSFKVQPMPEQHQDSKPKVLFQASNRYIWIGTEKGLFRYNGLDYERFLMPDSLSNNNVTAIGQIDGNLWVGYKDGSVFQQSGKRFQLWRVEEGLPKKPITGFGKGDNGLLWIATYGEGLYYYNGRHLYNINTDDGLPGDDIYTLYVDREGSAWVGTDGGLSRCRAKAEQKEIHTIGKADGMPDEIVRSVIPAETPGQFWVGTHSGGLALYDDQRKEVWVPTNSWPYGPINTLVAFHQQELWIGTDGDGLLRFNLTDSTLHLCPPSTMENGRVLDLLKDEEGNLWGIQQYYGIFNANRQFERIVQKLPDIQAVLEAKDGTIWAGCQDGLYRYHSLYNRFDLILNENTLSLYESPRGCLYAGTFGRGLFRIDPVTGKQTNYTEADGLSNGSVLDITAKDSTIWLATLGGVNSFQEVPLGERPVFSHRFDEQSALGTNFTYTVFPDSQGRIWFGTDGEGLSVLENGRLINYSAIDSIDILAVYSITEDKQGHIWFSTAKEGVFEYDGSKFRHLTLKEGIRDLAITSLIKAPDGNIIIVHPSGIDLLNPTTRHIIYYDQSIGVEGLEPNLNAVANGNNRSVWLGMGHHLYRYTALEEELSIHPKTLITKVSVFLETVKHESVSTFTHDQNNLIFEFIGLWYSNPNAVRYRYMLEGFDLDWITTRDQRAIYSNLPPGQYTFKVISTENETYSNEPVVTYDFEIEQPYWQKWWFILLVLGGATGVLIAWIRQRDRRQRRISVLEKEKVKSQFEALKSQINPHFLFNSFNTLAAIIEENPGEAVQYVDKLSDFYRSILQYREQAVINLSEELDLVKDYSYLLQYRFGQNLDFEYDVPNANRYAVVPFALQLLIENAVKHNVISQTRKLKITIKEKAGNLIISNNLQPKFTKAFSTGFGLESLRKRYDMLNTAPVVVSADANTFSVALPLLDAATNVHKNVFPTWIF
jgi:ligand-binding sensor domain-containing protein